jgi:D-psicose/D-tagatose/L-ribulose 3-epimerase
MTTPLANAVPNPLAVSNIAWPMDEEAAVARVLTELGVSQVEIAPTKVFDDPTAVSDDAIASYRAFWRDHGIEIAAFQSMLFGRQDLQIFDSAALRKQTLDRLAQFVVLAGRMGARVLVFGSPKNRIVPEGVSMDVAMDVVVPFFRELGSIAEDNNTAFCIEPNPAVYACNFVTTSTEGRELVSRVDSPGFGLHLDAAGMTLAGENVASAITASASMLRHFHVSAPELGELERDVVDHAAAAAALRDIGYSGTVSIEMRPGQPGAAPEYVRRAVDLARSFYSVTPAR